MLTELISTVKVKVLSVGEEEAISINNNLSYVVNHSQLLPHHIIT